MAVPSHRKEIPWKGVLIPGLPVFILARWGKDLLYK